MKMVLSDWLAVTSPSHTQTQIHTHTTECNDMSHSVISICAFVVTSSLILRCMYINICVCLCVCVCLRLTLCSNLECTVTNIDLICKEEEEKKKVREGGEGGDKEGY